MDLGGAVGETEGRDLDQPQKSMIKSIYVTGEYILRIYELFYERPSVNMQKISK